MFYDDDDIPAPRVQMPARLKPYDNIIEQEYYDMPLDVFNDM